MSATHGIGGDPEEALALARRVVEAAEAAGADEAEALVVAGESALTRFANSEIHQNVASAEVYVNLRFVRGKRVGVASTGRMDDDGMRALVERAGAIAANVDELEDWAGLPEAGAPAPLPAAWSDHTAHATPELRAEGARAVIAAADEAGVTAYGSFSHDAEALAVASSKGIAAAERRTSSQLLTVTMGPDKGTGYAEQCHVDATAIDAHAIGHEAAELARASANPVELAPGDYPVVLTSYAVVDVVDMLGYLGFTALAVQEDRSFYEPGKRVGSSLVSIADDSRDPAGLPVGFDAEGVPKQRLELLASGVCRDLPYDAQTAARAGVTSTGHGLPAPNPYGPFPTNMVMAAGDQSLEDLIGGIDRGLLVTRFWYTNPVHQKKVIITGMTRDGTFLVEGGRVVGPVRNLRFTQSYLDVLAGVEAVSRERRCIKGFLGGSVVPAVRVSSFTFTGVTADN
ncbi:MAG TPA: metallopeptidase TldD-related protein [Candidatus Limnocylindrales bacterium]|nr:metallopeptidase TldD-related protein [Candidatus Limnocylindrales bacterium]